MNKSDTHSLAEIGQIKSAFSKLGERTSEISKDYFQDRFMLKYWHKSLERFKGTIQYMEEPPILIHNAELLELVQVSHDARVPLLNAASRGLLTDKILSGIGERMEILNEAAECLHKHRGGPAPSYKW